MIHDIGHLSSRPRIYRRPSLWRRLCRRLDCHPVMMALLLVCMGYVGVLLAMVVRHMATGVW